MTASAHFPAEATTHWRPEQIARSFRCAEWIALRGTAEEKSGRHLPDGFTTPIPEELLDGRWRGTTRLVESGFNLVDDLPPGVSRVSASFRRALKASPEQ